MNLSELISELHEEEAAAYVAEALEKGVNPIQLIEEAQKGMETVGNKFRDNAYFLPELLISAEIFNGIMGTVKPHIKADSTKVLGKMVLGTVQGDLHDIGKNIFKTIAQAHGFVIYDLGVDVPIEKFAETAAKEQVDIIAMSGLLTTVFDTMKEAVALLEEKGLRGKVKVILGGAPMDEGVKTLVGADAWTRNASTGVDICKSFMEAKQ